MESVPSLDTAQWRQRCADIHASCQRQAMTSMHFSLLLSQSMEDALRTLPLEVVLEAIQIAREFDYETSSEIAEMVQWVSAHAQCKHGIQWRRCNSTCEKPCSSQHVAQPPRNQAAVRM